MINNRLPVFRQAIVSNTMKIIRIAIARQSIAMGEAGEPHPEIAEILCNKRTMFALSCCKSFVAKTAERTRHFIRPPAKPGALV